MDYLNLEKITGDPVKKSSTELVERKGIGHPDSISDGLAESVSRALSREYRKRTGKILHHNTDEVQLVAGESSPEFGGGELVSPIYVLLTGRATKKFEGEEIPVDEIALRAAREYVEDNFKVLSQDHIEFESRIGETSTDLKEIYSDSLPKSNDTSFGVGHAPLSPVEESVMRIEPHLIEEFSEVGEDVKVMALRDGDRIRLTVAAALISARVSSRERYQELKQEIAEEARKFFEDRTGIETEVTVNAADKPEEDSFYVTETGASAEMGDDGSVGRGNRINGLITPYRSMSLEAASGKNPVTHVGKIYNLLAKRIAREIYEDSSEFAQIRVLSQIGAPIDEPQTVQVETSADGEKVRNAVEKHLEQVEELREGFVEGSVSTF